MKNNYKVYIHIFPNEKVYIGITKQDVNKRWLKGKGYNNCPLMKKAIDKYGWNNIRHKILYDYLTKEEAEQKEIDLIKQYKSNNPKFGYNIENGGNCCGTHSEETKRKIGLKSKGRQTMLGRHITKEHIEKLKNGRIKKYKETGNYGFSNHKHTDEFKINMSKRMKGREVKEDTKKKISELKKGNKNCVGRYMSSETRKKIGDANKGRIWSEEQKKHLSEASTIKRKVNQYDLNGNFIKQYESLKQAQKETGILSQNIGEVCRGQQKYAKGYLWRYANDNSN